MTRRMGASPLRDARRRRPALAASLLVVLAATSGLAGCMSPDGAGADGLTGTISTDGSSTVAPLTDAARDLFAATHPDVEIKVSVTGTTAGFRAFCDGATDIANASRAIDDDEIAACEDGGIDYTEIVVANDGVSVIINPANDWATDLTVAQLATIWSPESAGTVTRWSQIDPSFPDEALVLFGPGTDSGTLDFFTAAITGEEDAIRSDYSASEDDNSTVEGVSKNAGAIGILGLSYVNENEGAIVAASIDGVAPDTDSVQDGSYTPLSRPLFIYVADSAYADRAEVRAFVDFYVDNALDIADRALVVPLTSEQVDLARAELSSLR